MSLRHAVLGLLALEPSTGYELTQKFDRSLRTAWHASHSQIYPELARLEEEGFAEVVGEGARRSRTWAVTEAGRAELHRWLNEVPPNRSQRNESALRWFLVFLLPDDERRSFLQGELEYVTAEAAARREMAEQIDAMGVRAAFRPLLDLGARVDAAMLEWLHDQLD